MSEERIPDYVFLLRVPRKPGKKTLKIELFHCSQFRYAWSFNRRYKFAPEVPMQKRAQDCYWKEERYRVRLNGKWEMLRGGFSYYFRFYSEIMNGIREYYDGL